MIQTDLPIVPIPDAPESAHSAFEMFKGLSLDEALTKFTNGLVDFAFKLVIAILVFYAGKFIITKLYNLIKTVMINRKVDASLTTFVLSLVKMVLYFILLITVVGILGLETSSFLALFASAGVAIGMALSGTLQNFAGGVLILLLKPYKVGNYIEASGYAGTVKAIQIFHTIINTPDNKTIIIPNGGLSTSSINNYSSENYRRVDWTVSLSYETDFDAAVKAIKSLLLEDDRVVVKYIEDDIERRRRAGLPEDLKNEDEVEESATEEDEEKADKGNAFTRLFSKSKRSAYKTRNKIKVKVGLGGVEIQKIDNSPFVGLNEMADSSINLTVRAWTHSSNYWPLFFHMNSVFFKRLPQMGFSFPFPQLDVHLPEAK